MSGNKETITFDDLNLAVEADPLHLRDMAWRFLQERDEAERKLALLATTYNVEAMLRAVEARE